MEGEVVKEEADGERCSHIWMAFAGIRPHARLSEGVSELWEAR
jgi:hypothetical protein